MTKGNVQLHFLPKESKPYGGELRNTRKGRQGSRPLAVRSTMHLVLRSTRAKGPWSFKRHDKKIRGIIRKFSTRHGVKILSLANVGNHLHFHIQLSNRYRWRPFIRAITAAIAMAVTGKSRWSKPKLTVRFWDYRPFTRVLQSWKEFLNLNDYIEINQLEGMGCSRVKARWIVKNGFKKNKYVNSA